MSKPQLSHRFPRFPNGAKQRNSNLFVQYKWNVFLKKKKMSAWEIKSKSSQTSPELLRGIDDKKKVSTFCFSFCFPWNDFIATRFSVTRNDLRIPIQEFDVGEHVSFFEVLVQMKRWRYLENSGTKTKVYFHIAAFTRHTRPFLLPYSLDNDITLGIRHWWLADWSRMPTRSQCRRRYQIATSSQAGLGLRYRTPRQKPSQWSKVSSFAVFRSQASGSGHLSQSWNNAGVSWCNTCALLFQITSCWANVKL